MGPRFYTLLLAVITIMFVSSSFGQENYDSLVVEKIMDEGMNRSQVMKLLWDMTDRLGPRLTWSPSYKRAAEWAKKQLTEWGAENAHFDSWTPTGKGWDVKRFSLHMIEPQTTPLVAYPKAWSPSTKGTVTGDVVIFDAKTDSALDTFKGKLKGKFVLFADTLRAIEPHWKPEASRVADSSLLQMANADGVSGRRGRGGRGEMSPEQKERAMVAYRKLLMCQQEGVAMVLTPSYGDGGNVYVQQASVANHPDTSSANRLGAYSPKAPVIPPQASISAEHFNRLFRLARNGERVRLEANLDAMFFKEDSGYNIIAEIPGSDLKDEVVMIGGHFDSWQGGTGATDNATGSAVAMEAIRIIKTLNLTPRRTIRIALWGGEEQGLIGSREYVKEVFGSHEGSASDDRGKIELKPAAEKFSVYFNDDNGGGRFRGVHMQGNEAVRPIFRSWLTPFAELGASTLTLRNTGGTDHLSFDAIGLPGFQFIQDGIEYGTRTHHSTMDVYDRVIADDLKQSAVIMATFAYHAAMRDEKFPRKALPQPQVTQGSR